VRTLREPRRRGHHLGLVSVCSEEVVQLRTRRRSPRLFEAQVSSCSAGAAKPGPAELLDVRRTLGGAVDDALFAVTGATTS
jgi:hypothetical protein